NSFNPDGTYDYVPNPNYNGTDSFIYELCDVDGDCDTAIVIITILPVNDAPVANADVNSTNEDTPIVGAMVVTNDIPSGDGGNVYNNTCVVCTTTTNGALTFNPDGTYDYVPNAAHPVSDSFIYELCDVDGDCDTALVIITILPVNDAPVALDDAGLTFEDIPLTIDVQSNDSDPENDVLTTGVVVQPLHGTAVVVNTDSITYFPAPDFNGQDT